MCGAVLGMGKVNSSASMQAILLNPKFDFSKAYYVISGVAGTPPGRGTIGEVNWATRLVLRPRPSVGAGGKKIRRADIHAAQGL
ncbi:MAG: hypothetical protein WKG52_12340 [Variovorax sp.]